LNYWHHCLGLWCLMPLPTIYQLHCFIGGGKSPTCHKSLTNFIRYCCIEYTLSWAGFKLKTLLVIAQVVVNQNYHMIMTTMAPPSLFKISFSYFMFINIIICNISFVTWNHSRYSLYISGFLCIKGLKRDLNQQCGILFDFILTILLFSKQWIIIYVYLCFTGVWFIK
jgi:hypothetical protein